MRIGGSISQYCRDNIDMHLCVSLRTCHHQSEVNQEVEADVEVGSLAESSLSVRRSQGVTESYAYRILCLLRSSDTRREFNMHRTRWVSIYRCGADTWIISMTCACSTTRGLDCAPFVLCSDLQAILVPVLLSINNEKSYRRNVECNDRHMSGAKWRKNGFNMSFSSADNRHAKVLSKAPILQRPAARCDLFVRHQFLSRNKYCHTESVQKFGRDRQSRLRPAVS